MTDLIVGIAKGYAWDAIEPFAVSVEQSGFAGDRVLFVKNASDDTRKNLEALHFTLVEIPDLPFEEPKYWHYSYRFFLIQRYLSLHQDYRFVFCADTRDLVFQRNPSEWMEKNIGDKQLVAASEFLLHQDSPPNMQWVNSMYQEVAEWWSPQMIYCSGFIAGRAPYVRDLARSIYLYSRAFTNTIWGSDQPIYNTLMHSKPYADITLVPTMKDRFCLNCVNIAFDDLRKNMTESLDSERVGDFVVLHQYDRCSSLVPLIRQKYALPV